MEKRAAASPATSTRHSRLASSEPSRPASVPSRSAPALFGEIAPPHVTPPDAWETFAHIASALPIALVGVDAAGRVRFVSSGTRRILDSLDRRTIGQPIAAVLRRLGRRHRAPGLEGLGALLQSPAGAVEASSSWRFDVRSESGTRLIQAEFSPLPHTAAPSALSRILVLQDITDAQRLEETTREVGHLASLGQVAACIAHEVRNPLSAMTSSAQFLAEMRSDDDLVGRYTRIIIDEAQRLERLIGDFLAHARPPALRFLPTSMEDVLQRCCALLERDAAAAGVTLDIRRRRPLPLVSADAEGLLQALLNLGKNAIEATPPGGRVTVSAGCPASLPGHIEVTVRDGGAGIPRKDLANVLMPFFTTKVGGTGLGLPIAKKVIESHGGRLTLSSQPGGGTRARCVIPVTRDE